MPFRWPHRPALDPVLRLEHRAALHELAANLTEAHTAARAAAEDREDPEALLGLLCDRTIAATTVLQTLPAPLLAATAELDRDLTRLLRRAESARGRAGTGQAAPLLDGLLHTSAFLPAAGAAASGLADDFTGAVLRRADLENLHLPGVRWDRTTRWPRHWRSRITASSRARDDGTFEIQAAHH